MSLDLSALFEPRGIAVVGASTDLGRIGGQPIFALTEFGYEGAVYPINPKYPEIRGLKCYGSVTEVPEPCDVALIAVPAKAVPQAILDCGTRGIPFAVVLSAGFREVAGGEQAQRQLDEAIARSNVRVVGPNCQGLLNIRKSVYCGFGAPFQNPHPHSGGVALVTQSGGFGYAVLGLAESAGTGFNCVVSTGNEADIDTLDLIDYLLDRDDVEVVATYMEGIVDGRRLIALGEKAHALGKPIVVWKVGNTETGRAAAASHTANLSASYELYRAAFRHPGFVPVRDVDDLVDVAKAFANRRRPMGSRVGVMSISGGAGVLLADRCHELGLQLPPLSPPSLAQLKEFMPEFASVANPIDVTAQIFNDLAMFRRALGIIIRDPNVDQVIVYNASIQGATAARLAHELTLVAAETDKPVLVGSSAPPGKATEALEAFAKANLPCYPTPGRAAAAAAALHAFWSAPSVSGKIERSVPRAELPLGEGALSETEAKRCLQAYGIPIVREVILTAEEALSGKIGLPFAFPVVAKIDSPDLPHKTEAGAVRVGIGSLEALAAATRDMLASANRYRPGLRVNGISVQEMATGLEMLAGAVNDPYFGPVVVFGLGGIFAELFGEVVHEFAPFSVETARRLIRSTRAAALFDGIRGQAPLDLEAMASTLSRLSHLASDHADRIAEIDINPVFVRPMGQGVVAADALVVLKQEGAPR
ncbi:MAG: acetate--CoA ligase family protein [Usitatibacter sp.]